MPKYTEEELRKRARSAIRHTELVQLARDPNISPMRAKEIAQSKNWPKRPVEAVIHLTMIRRDYGPEALEAFISQTERARSEKPETEQARLEKQVDKRIQAALNRTTDSKQRITIMAQNGLGDELVNYLMELGRTTHDIYFYNSGRNVRGPDLLPPPEGSDKNKDEPLRSAVFMFIPKKRSSTDCRSAEFKLSYWTLSFMDGDTGLLEELLTQVMEHFVAEVEPNRHHHPHMLETTLAVAVHNSMDADPHPLYQAALATVLTCYFMDQVNQDSLGRHLEIDHRVNQDELVKLFWEKMLELGKTPDEIKQIFLNWLGSAAKAYHPQSWPAVFKSRPPQEIHKQSASYQAQVKTILREQLLPNIWNRCLGRDLSKGRDEIQCGVWWMWDVLREVLKLVGYEHRGSLQRFFQAEIVNMISRGHVGLAYQFLHYFGKILGFTSDYGRDAKNPKQVIMGLAPAAFQSAFQAERWGVAAALYQHFGDQVLPDKQTAAKQSERLYVWRFYEEFDGELLTCHCDECRSGEEQDGPELRPMKLSSFDDVFDFIDSGWLYEDEHNAGQPKLIAQEERIKPLWVECIAKFDELIAEQKKRGSVAVDMAEVTKQPIRLELFDLIQFEKD